MSCSPETLLTFPDMKILCAIALVLSFMSTAGQSYTSWVTGDGDDVESNPDAMLVLAGGAGESDPAMIRFLEGADGGDVLVMREVDAGGTVVRRARLTLRHERSGGAFVARDEGRALEQTGEPDDEHSECDEGKSVANETRSPRMSSRN